MYKTVDIALIINALTGEIEDVSITLVTREAILFLKQIIIGFNIEEKPIEELLESVKTRYYGESVKAILVALRGAAIRYLEWKNLIKVNK